MGPGRHRAGRLGRGLRPAADGRSVDSGSAGPRGPRGRGLVAVQVRGVVRGPAAGLLGLRGGGPASAGGLVRGAAVRRAFPARRAGGRGRLADPRPAGVRRARLPRLFEAAVAQFRGEVDEAASLAERATELGQRFGDRDLVAMGIHLQGLARISAGGVAEGMALLDEAMTWVVAGELNPYFTGVIYCNVLSICLELADLARAAEWNKAATAWCESLPEDAPFPGLCRLNRIEAANLRGAWSDAETEAKRASEELTFNPRAAGHAFYETGEIRRRIGNF